MKAICKMRLRHIFAILLLAVIGTTSAKPRLVVNIVVSGMRQCDLNRYEKNFGEGGFRRLMREGATFTECYADYAPTTSEAGLATLATGATPSTHGIFSDRGFDRTANKEFALCHKEPSARDELLGTRVESSFSTNHLFAETLAELSCTHNKQGRAITIAHNALSAILLAGKRGEAYWIGENGSWTTADCYSDTLPSWVNTYNSDDLNRVFAAGSWYGRYTRDKYRNTRATDITLYESDNAKQTKSVATTTTNWISALHSRPSGNIALFEFAKRAVGSLLPLHIEDECKVLNICLDVPRYIAEHYGADSIEYEDTLYSIDAMLAEFLGFLYAQFPSREDLVVVLTSDGGISPTHLDNNDGERFNSRQFEVILNAFLGARYGQDSWIAGYFDGSLYLNHDVVYRHKQTLSDIQNEVATFALQFRGVANAITATALRNAQFTRNEMSLVQSGYNPRTSGDVMILLEPKRIERSEMKVAMSGSIYHYDRHIPLIICGGGVAPTTTGKRVSNDQIAPTIARLLNISSPLCATGNVIEIR